MTSILRVTDQIWQTPSSAMVAPVSYDSAWSQIDPAGRFSTQTPLNPKKSRYMRAADEFLKGNPR